MKHHLLRLLAGFALLAVSASAVDVKPPTFVPASGLQLSLDTGGYKFLVGDSTTTPTTTRAAAAKLGGLLPTLDGFAARAVLANTSRSEIHFEFGDPFSASVKFKFSVLDAKGALVWQSDADVVAAQVVTPATLTPGARWKRMMQIPLKVNGTWLAPGIYTLEAFLPASPSVSASTIFEVSSMTPPPTETGISGLVLFGPFTPVTQIGVPNEKPLAGAKVSIEEIRQIGVFYIHPPFHWSGWADGDGKFKAVTPPGRFHVEANIPPTTPGPVPPTTPGTPGPVVNAVSVIQIGGPGVAEVTVTDGHFSDVTLHVDSGIR